MIKNTFQSKYNRFRRPRRKKFQLPLDTRIQVIDQHGNNLGVLTVSEALEKSNNEQLDLVEVSATTNPAIFKIMDYGKHQYQQQKKQSEAKKSQKQNTIKEIKLRPLIDSHDYRVKVNKIIDFLKQQDSVKIVIRMRGREISHRELGINMIERIKDDIKDYGQLVMNTRIPNPRLLNAMITPHVTKPS